MKETRLLCSLFAFALITAATCHGAILIQENFGGNQADTLLGTNADVFSPDIVTAGGNGTWSVSSSSTGVFRANGEIFYNGSSTSIDRSVFLGLGSYVDDAKGTANGKFVFSITIAEVTFSTTNSGVWATAGFFNGAPPTTGNFTSTRGDPTLAYGMATIIKRATGDSNDFYAGAGFANGFNSPDSTDPRNYIVELDFTPEGGYDGTTNFGTVTYKVDNGPANGYSYTYTEDNSFSHLGFTMNDSANTRFSNLLFTQVPEPSAALLGALGSLALLRRRR